MSEKSTTKSTSGQILTRQQAKLESAATNARNVSYSSMVHEDENEVFVVEDSAQDRLAVMECKYSELTDSNTELEREVYDLKSKLINFESARNLIKKNKSKFSSLETENLKFKLELDSKSATISELRGENKEMLDAISKLQDIILEHNKSTDLNSGHAEDIRRLSTKIDNLKADDDLPGQALLDGVFAHLNLLETAYFGLRYLDQDGQTHWLDPSKKLSRQLRGNSDPFTLYFGVKFYAADPCKLLEEITRYQLFLQVKQDILRGRLPVSFEMAAELGAYIVQSELGDYDPRRHSHGYVSEFRFLSNQTQELEARISELHKPLIGQRPSQAELSYLDKVKWLDMYGVDLHPVLGEDNVEYFLGLTPSGIIVLRNKHPVANYYWPRIAKIYFKGKYFMLRVCDKNNDASTYGFETPSKAACKHLWRCCVEHHAFFRLVQVSPTTPDIFALGSRFRYSGRTERQAVKDAHAQGRAPPAFSRTPSRRQQRRSGEGAIETPRVEGSKPTQEIKHVSIPQPAHSFDSPYRSTCSIPAALGTHGGTGHSTGRRGTGADSPRSTRSAPWTQPHSRGLFGAPPASPRSVRSASGGPRGNNHRSSSVDSQSSNDSRSCKRHRHRSRRTSDNDSELSRSSGRSHRKHRRHRSRHKRGDSGSENDSKHKSRVHRNSSATNYELVDSGSQWREVQRRQAEAATGGAAGPGNVQHASVKKSGVATPGGGARGGGAYVNNAAEGDNGADIGNGYHTSSSRGRRHRKHRSRSRSPSESGTGKTKSGTKAWPSELSRHLEWDLVDTTGMSESQRREIPYTVVQTGHQRLRVRTKHSSIKEEPSGVTGSPIRHKGALGQVSGAEYPPSTGSIRSSSTVSSERHSNDNRLPRMMNSLSMNEFSGSARAQGSIHPITMAALGGFAGGAQGLTGGLGGHSSSGESALRVSHEHTDSGLGAEQDYAYSSERSSDSAKYVQGISNTALNVSSSKISQQQKQNPLSMTPTDKKPPLNPSTNIATTMRPSQSTPMTNYRSSNNPTSDVNKSTTSYKSNNCHNTAYTTNNSASLNLHSYTSANLQMLNHVYNPNLKTGIDHADLGYGLTNAQRILTDSRYPFWDYVNAPNNTTRYRIPSPKSDIVTSHRSSSSYQSHNPYGTLPKNKDGGDVVNGYSDRYTACSQHLTNSSRSKGSVKSLVSVKSEGGRAPSRGPLMYIEANGNSIFHRSDQPNRRSVHSMYSDSNSMSGQRGVAPVRRASATPPVPSHHSSPTPPATKSRSASLEMILKPLIQSTQTQGH